MKLMSKSIVVAIIVTSLFGLGRAFAETALPEINVGFGSLKLGVILQAYYSYNEDDAVADMFKVRRARLLLTGTLLTDKLKYFIQSDMTTSPALVNTMLQFYYIPKTELAVGRLFPQFTLYMPQSTAKLDLVNYPLVTSKYGMFGQSGIQSTTKTQYADFILGVFNGYQGSSSFNSSTGAYSSSFAGNDWGDENDAKDFLLRANIKPVSGLTVAGYYWLGKPGFTYTQGSSTEQKDYSADRFGGFADYRYQNLHVTAEYVAGSTDAYTATPNDDGSMMLRKSTTDSHGYFLQGAYKVTKEIELLARYEMFDPNTDTDDNAMTWTTLGLNYHLLEDYHAIAALNYILKDEEAKDVDNNELIVQVQFFI